MAEETAVVGNTSTTTSISDASGPRTIINSSTNHHPNNNPIMDDPTSSDFIIRRGTLTLKDFLEARQLDHVVAELMTKYGDESGVFTKEEVANLVCDLKESIEKNKILLHSTLFIKRLLIFVLIFCGFLLAGMFGLSYAVAAMTATTQVSSQGTMMTTNKMNPQLIATDSVATMFDVGNHNEQGIFCIPQEMSTQIHDSVTQGRNVFMKFGDQASGNTTIYQWKAGGTTSYPDGTVCFNNGPSNDLPYTCIVPKPEGCTAVDSNGRRLGVSSNNDEEPPVLGACACKSKPCSC